MALDAKKLNGLTDGRHPDGEGLYFRVTRTGVRSWVARVQRPGGLSETFRVLGHWPAVGLAQARILAKAAQADSKRGLLAPSPRATRQARTQEPAAAVGPTLGAVWKAYASTALAAGKWTQRHHDKTAERVVAHVEALLERPVATLTRAEVVAACEAVESRETGQRIYRWLRGACDHAMDRGELEAHPFGTKIPLSLSVPAADRGTLRGDLSVDGYRALYRASWDSDAAFSVRALHRVIALSGHRIGAARMAQAEHVDLTAGVWVMPRGLLKVKDAKRGDFVIRMQGALLETMKEAVRRNPTGLLFKGPTTGAALSEESVEKHVKKHAPGRFTPHSWRSAILTWAVEAGYPREIAMAAIDHQRATGATVAYDASRHIASVSELLAAWGLHLGAETPADPLRSTAQGAISET